MFGLIMIKKRLSSLENAKRCESGQHEWALRFSPGDHRWPINQKKIILFIQCTHCEAFPPKENVFTDYAQND